MNPQQTEPIEDYLDELLLLAQMPPRVTRELLAEAEHHLRENAARLEQLGWDRQVAEREAVRLFGSPTAIGAAERLALRPTLGQTVAAIGQALLMLAGLGLTAIGASGLLAWVINGVAGPRFVGALPETYPASLCRNYLLIHPTAATCRQAAMLETSSDAVALRLLPGILGIVCLAAFWLCRRTNRPIGPLAAVSTVAVGVAALAFGSAATFLAGEAIDLAVQHGSGGVGWYLTGAIVAAIAAIPCAISTGRKLRRLLKSSYSYGVLRPAG